MSSRKSSRPAPAERLRRRDPLPTLHSKRTNSKPPGVAKEEAERRARASFGSVAAARRRFNLRGRML